MFYMNEKLVASIQNDRMREAEAARLNSLPNAPKAQRHRLSDLWSAMGIARRRTQPVAPTNSV